jgi:hypothetical protein
MRSTLDYENEFQFQFQLEIVATLHRGVNNLKTRRTLSTHGCTTDWVQRRAGRLETAGQDHDQGAAPEGGEGR